MKTPVSARSLPAKSGAQTGQFVLSQAKGEAISAVEGLRLTARMRNTVQHTDARLLSSDQRRSLVKEALSKGLFR